MKAGPLTPRGEVKRQNVDPGFAGRCRRFGRVPGRLGFPASPRQPHAFFGAGRCRRLRRHLARRGAAALAGAGSGSRCRPRPTCGRPSPWPGADRRGDRSSGLGPAARRPSPRAACVWEAFCCWASSSFTCSTSPPARCTPEFVAGRVYHNVVRGLPRLARGPGLPRCFRSSGAASGHGLWAASGEPGARPDRDPRRRRRPAVWSRRSVGLLFASVPAAVLLGVLR